MKIVTYNIQFGLGKDGHFDLARIAREIEDADIIALQEVERYWQRSGNVDQPAELAKLLSKYYWAYGPYFDVDASSILADGNIKNVRRQFGNLILSKTPIISTRLFPLPKSELRQRHNMVVGVFEGVIKLKNNGALRIYNAHLGARSQYDRIKQINAIHDIIRHAPAEGGAWTCPHSNLLWEEDSTPPPMPEPFILLGDFNLEAKDPEYDYLVGPQDTEFKRLTTKENLIDTWVATGKDENEGTTFSEQVSPNQTRNMRIDFAFVDESMQKKIVSARIDEQAQGSDHQPYWVEIDHE